MKLFKKFQFNVFALSVVLMVFMGLGSISWGSACCGGGVATASVITGDDQGQITTSYSKARVEARVQSDGIWRHVADDETTDTLKLDVAHIFADRYQYGFSIPMLKKRQNGPMGGESSGVGDVSGLLGYEYLPDWDYNPMKPKGIGYLVLVAPTGPSKYESNSLLQTHGRGFWTLGIGTALTKAWTVWDASLIFDLHRSFARSADTDQGVIHVQPGFGQSASVGLGYNFKKFRWGLSLAAVQEDPVQISGASTTSESLERYATGTVAASYMFPESLTGTLSYSDQLVFGNPTNTTLSKIFLFSLQRRWLR